MLPITHGEPATRRAILTYSIVLTAVTLLVGPIAGLGAIYTVSAALLGGAFVFQAARLVRTAATAAAIRLFRFSILYLFVLFLVMLLEAMWRLR